jgi:hypothetical protein
VATWNGSAWVQQAQVTGNGQLYRWIRFAAPVTSRQVQLTVTLDQDTLAGEFTRISELAPRAPPGACVTGGTSAAAGRVPRATPESRSRSSSDIPVHTGCCRIG